MFRALLRKELLQHRLAMFGIAAFDGLGLLLVRGFAEAQGEGSAVGGLRFFLATFGPLSALALAHRLVVQEYQGQTQLFLESLPVSRTAVLAVKWAVGAAFVLTLVTAALAMAWAQAAHEPLAPRLLWLSFARAATFSLAVWCYLFTTSLLGRYRHGAWLATALALYVADQLLQASVGRFPAFALLDARFGYEREELPLAALGWTWAFSAGLLALAGALAALRGGSVATLLAQKMSSREKVLISCVLLGLASLALQLEGKKPKPPFELADAEQVQVGMARVWVARGELPLEPGRALAQQVAEELDALREYLGLAELPRVFLVPSAELDSGAYLPAELADADGLVVKVNWASPSFDERDFETDWLHHVLTWYSRGRAQLEPRHWVLDGLTALWPERGDAALRERAALRAAFALEEPPSPELFLSWRRTESRLGPCLGNAVAASALRALEQAAGPEALRAFLREVLGRRPASDARALLFETKVERALSLHAGLSLAQLFERWRAQWQADRLRLGPALATIPPRSVSFEARAISEQSFELRARWAGPEEARPTRYFVVYDRVGPFGGGLDTYELDRFDARGDRDEALPQSFGRDDAVLVAAEVRDPSLGCLVRFSQTEQRF